MSRLMRLLGWNGFRTSITSKEEVEKLLSTLHPVVAEQGLIRVGPFSDGGYVVPNDLDGIGACFSPGVGCTSGFEEACANRGMDVFLADASVDGPPTAHERFAFSKKFVGATSNDAYMTLDHWVSSSVASDRSDLLLQIDIEGYEYEVFLSASDKLMQRFRVIVAEFHWLDQLWSRPFFNLARSVFDKITQTHRCVHLHPNNYCGYLQKRGVTMPKTMEFAFLRKDRLSSEVYETRFPHPLDCDTDPGKPTLVVPKCWYRQENGQRESLRRAG